MHRKLTALVRYHLRYESMVQPLMISFVLGVDVAVSLIIGLPTLRIWEGLLNSYNNKLIVPAIGTQFPLLYELTKQGLTPSVEFPDGTFIRPTCGHNNVVSALLTNIDANLSPTVNPLNPVNTVTSPTILEYNTASCFRQVVQTTETA